MRIRIEGDRLREQNGQNYREVMGQKDAIVGMKGATRSDPGEGVS